MAKIGEQQLLEVLEQIKRLLILTLDEQDVEGKRIAEVMAVDPAVVSRILSPKKPKK
jgi:predicted transcriptional regulator